MGKPTYRDRFTIHGQDEHESRPAGNATVPNDTSVSVYYDTADSGAEGGGTYDSGARAVGYGENITSAIKNRGTWATTQCLDHMYEQWVPRPDYEATVAGAGEANFQITSSLGPPYHSAVGFLGIEGDGASAAIRYYALFAQTHADVIDANDDKIVVEEVLVDVPAGSTPGAGTQTCYPVGGLPALTTGALPKIATVGTANNYDLTLDAALTGALDGVGIFNYSHWLRRSKAYRAGTATIDAMEEAFATCIYSSDAYASEQLFEVHRDITAAGVDWQVDDEIMICHYAFEPRVVFYAAVGGGATNVPNGTTYIVGHSSFSTLGELIETTITGTLEHGFNHIHASVIQGLDGSYDITGIGPDGAGREIKVDSGPVKADIQAYGEMGFESGSDSVSMYGSVGFAALVRNNAPDIDRESTGHLAATRIVFNNASGSICLLDDDCTATGQEVNNSGFATRQFSVGGTDFDIFEGLDLIYLTDGTNPITTTSSPNGFYIISQVTGANTIDINMMNGSAPNLTGAGVTNYTIFRPVFTGMAGNIGHHDGAPASPHETSNFASRGIDSAVDYAAEFNAPWDYNTSVPGYFTAHFIGNVNRTQAVAMDSFAEMASYATHYGPRRLLGCIGSTINDIDVIIEALEKTDADDLIFGWTWSEFSPGTDTATVRWDADKATATAPVSVVGNYPFGSSSGLDMDSAGTHLADPVSFTLGARGSNDHIELTASYHDLVAGATKLYGGLEAYFEGATTTKEAWAKLRETPIAGAGTPSVPQTPVTTAVDTDIEHRFEIEHDTNIGWSDWRTIYKVINMSLGNCADANGASWSSVTLGGPPGGVIWTYNADASNDWVYFPLLVPHGSKITEVFCRFYASQALAGAAAALDVFRIDSSSMTGAAGALVTVAALGGAGSTAMNPGAGTTSNYTYTCDQNNVVDLETYEYVARIAAGQSGGGGATQKILQMKVKFLQVDIFPE